MSFVDCIQTAVRDGRIRAEKGDEAIAAYQRHYDADIALGVEPEKAALNAGLRGLDEVTTLTSRKKWERLNELKVGHKLSTEIDALPSIQAIEDYLPAMVERMNVRANSIAGQALARMDKALEKYRPRASGLIRPTQDLDEIVRAAYGQKASQTGKELSEQFLDTHEYLRKLANSKGALIPENKNWRLPQQLDTQLVRRIGRTLDESKEIWVKDMLEHADFDLMEFEGRKILPHERKAVLERTFMSIVTEGASRIVPASGGRAVSLGTRLGRERFIYYKSADSWLAMNKKYGAGNVYEQMVAMVDTMARDIAVLEELGPNPASMQNYLGNVVRRKAGTLQTSRGRSSVERAESALNLFDSMLRMHTRSFLSGEDSWTTQALGGFSNVVTAAVLQASTIANLGDIFNIARINRQHGIPHQRLLSKFIRNFVPNKENRRFAMQSGLIFESAISQVTQSMRYIGPMAGGNLSRRFSDSFFRFILMRRLDQAMKWTIGQQTMGAFGIYRNRTWDKLPQNFRESLTAGRITPVDWESFRQTPPTKVGQEEFIRPMDASDMNVGNKFMDYVYEIQNLAVLGNDVRSSAALGGSLDRTSLLGRFALLARPLKGFPISVHFQAMKGLLRGEGPGNKWVNIARFMVYFTLAGATITQLRALSQGRDPEDMTDPKFWMKAVMNGGTLGLAGDLMNSLITQQFGSGISESITGPSFQVAEDLAHLIVLNPIQAAQGEDPNFAGDLYNFARKYAPIGWQLRTLLHRAFLDEWLRLSDPRAYNRAKQNERRRASESGNEAWWPMGAAGPQRMPNFGAAIGL